MVSNKDLESFYWLYNMNKDFSSTMYKIEEFSKQNEITISLFALICKEDLFKIIKSWKPKDFDFKSLDTEETSKNSASLSIIRHIKRTKLKSMPEKIKGNALIFRSDIPNVYIIISHESPYIMDEVIIKFFNKYFPEISRIRQSSFDLYKILKSLNKEIEGEVEIVTEKVVAYKRIERKVERQKRRKSVVTYTDEPFEDSFKEAIDSDQFIDKIEFTLNKDKKTIFNAYLSRNGISRVDNNIKLFFDKIFLELIRVGRDKMNFYEGRSRLLQKDLNTKPFDIEFDFDIFKDSFQNKKLINSLLEMPNASVSVYHANPYLSVSFLDYLDGSSCKIWVVSSKKITIVPQLKSSYASLQRLVNHIFESFREGQIKEFKKEE
jgi:hypothetical protein